MAAFLVHAGKAIVTNRLISAGTIPEFIGWGTGGGAAAEDDTDLTTPSAEARTDGVASRVTTTVTNDTYQVVGTIVSLSTQSIDEVGVFDAITAGNLFVLADFAAIPLEEDDSIQFTIKVQFTSA